MTGQSSDHPPDNRRRELLKLGAAGVVGSLAACAVPGVHREGDNGALQAPPVPDRGLSESAPIPPEVGNLVDPELLAAETWQEPWTWRPELWPGDALELNVVENQSPGPSPSSGNPNAALFSFNGISPGPTVRVRGDGELQVRLRNLLGQNHGMVPVGPMPDPFDLPPDLAQEICTLAGMPPGPDGNIPTCGVPGFPEETQRVTGHDQRVDWDIGGHINGIHGARTTNLHTHGLHVSPGSNGDGSHSDNVLLRIIPQADFAARRAARGADAEVLLENEYVGKVDYRYELSFGREGQRMPHPPGTHWYHPHAHGSTHNQVSSGMAGYLVVEGDVDEAINRRMTGEPRPDPELSTGPWDYRERLVFLQRAELGSSDHGAPPKKASLRFPPPMADDEAHPPPVLRMRPGAVERWRVLNGSVDGAGTKRFMVLKGQYVLRANRIWRVHAEGEGPQRRRRLELVDEQDFENAKANLHLLAFDGITLVREENGRARHRIKDLSRQNAGTENPLASPAAAGENEITRWLRAYQSVWKDGDSLRRAFVRPNEVYLSNANRADLLFRAPRDAAGQVFTIFAKEAHLHNDNFQQRLQGRAHDPGFRVMRDLFDVVVAYIHVTGDPVPGEDFDLQSLDDVLPPVPPLLQPVAESELQAPAAEARLTGVEPGSRRTRTLSYSGLGGNTFPIIQVPREYTEQHPELERLTWWVYDGVPVLVQDISGSMGINTEFDLTHHPEPMAPRKFGHHDPYRSRVLVDTAEEWVVYNSSMTLWAHTDRERFPQPGSYNLRYRSYPVSRAEGQRRYAEDPEFMITSRATDHPFHIHVNPMWVLRIDVPDEHGELHNILPEPMWMDTVSIPRNGGRVVFRSRFEDFVGSWVHHCHILLHEDHGMMQVVECTDDVREANYKPRTAVAGHRMSGADVDAIYPKPSLELMYRQNIRFVDPNDVAPYEFPGFEFEVPRLP